MENLPRSLVWVLLRGERDKFGKMGAGLSQHYTVYLGQAAIFLNEWEMRVDFAWLFDGLPSLGIQKN